MLARRAKWLCRNASRWVTVLSSGCAGTHLRWVTVLSSASEAIPRTMHFTSRASGSMARAAELSAAPAAVTRTARSSTFHIVVSRQNRGHALWADEGLAHAAVSLGADSAGDAGGGWITRRRS